MANGEKSQPRTTEPEHTAQATNLPKVVRPTTVKKGK